MMSKLVLHIGLHKTGTSSFQKLCFHKAAALEKRGVIYPRLRSAVYPEGVLGHHGLTLNLAKSFPQFVLEKGAERAWARFVDRYAKTDKTLLISSEEFSRGRKGFRVDMRRLSEITSAFDEVQIVCMLRHQFAFLQSVYFETTKAGRMIKPEFLVGNAIAHNDAKGLWADWNPLYDHLLTGYAADQITFLDYETAKASQIGVIGQILAHTGVTYQGAQETSNSSAPPLAHLLCHAKMGPQLYGSDLLQRVCTLIDAAFGAGRPTTLFTRNQVTRMLAHFEAPNAQLVARIRKTQPDFSLTPAHLPENLIYADDISAELMSNVRGL